MSLKKIMKLVFLTFYVSQVDYELDIPAIIVTDIKKAMSLIAMEFYGHP